MKNWLLNLVHRGISFFAFIDSSSYVSSKASVYRFAKIIRSNISEYSYVGIGTTVIDTQIGTFCSIASKVFIGLESHSMDCISTSPIFSERINALGYSWCKKDTYNHSAKTIIGHDVWIGYKALVKGGVKIGNGAIVAAAAVVTKDVPNYAIVAGVPARIIRYRFPDEVIECLERIKWWEKDTAVLKDYITCFQHKLSIEDLSKLSAAFHSTVSL